MEPILNQNEIMDCFHCKIWGDPFLVLPASNGRQCLVSSDFWSSGERCSQKLSPFFHEDEGQEETLQDYVLHFVFRQFWSLLGQGGISRAPAVLLVVTPYHHVQYTSVSSSRTILDVTWTPGLHINIPDSPKESRMVSKYVAEHWWHKDWLSWCWNCVPWCFRSQ